MKYIHNPITFVNHCIIESNRIFNQKLIVLWKKKIISEVLEKLGLMIIKILQYIMIKIL